MKRSPLLFSCCCFIMLSAAGCSDMDNVAVYPVRGTIRLEGETFSGGGSIAFVPMSKQAGKTAGGQIQSDGTYVLTTYSMGDGSMKGYFRVIITQEVASDGDPIPDGEVTPKGGAPAVEMVAAEDRIPVAYADPEKTPLRATVEPRSNEINFDLQRKLNQGDGRQVPPGVARRQKATDAAAPAKLKNQSAQGKIVAGVSLR